MEKECLFGLADRDEGSVDLADEVRVMLGAFLCPRVGLVAVETGRWPQTDIVNGVSSGLKGITTYRLWRSKCAKNKPPHTRVIPTTHVMRGQYLIRHTGTLTFPGGDFLPCPG